MSFDQIIAFHIYVYIFFFSQGVHINIYTRVRSRPRVSVSPTWRRKVETVQPGNSLASDQYPRDVIRHVGLKNDIQSVRFPTLNAIRDLIRFRIRASFFH